MRATRRAAVPAALLVGACLLATPASARESGEAPSTGAASSGSWGALASLSATPPYAYASVTRTVSSNTGVLGYLVNTGSIPLSGATYSLTLTGKNGGSVALQTCTGGTWTASGSTYACSGGTVATIASVTMGTTTTTAASTVPATPGATMAILIKDTNASGTLTIGVSVARTQARAATTTSS